MSTKSKKPGKGSRGGLLLENGAFFPGRPFGFSGTKIGEVVFHTGHSGYQEILTDPSYAKQILVFSAPHIGNQGFHPDDFESARIWASGCITREVSEGLGHFRNEANLETVLKQQECPGLSGVDTRRLILTLREKGSLWGVISTETDSVEALKKYLKDPLSMEGLGLTSEVSTKSAFRWTEGSRFLDAPKVSRSESGLKRVVVMDFGVKRQILRYLIDVGFEEVWVVPAKTTAKEILEKYKPEAVMLSNGPGDPAADLSIIEEVKQFVGKLPLFGICLGHQILALALGLKTYKLKFGHHAANHPVKNLESGKVEISSQNHGFAVEQVPHKDIEWNSINLNDLTIEGFRHKRYPIVALQFHPEAGPGPRDSVQIFEQFQQGFELKLSAVQTP